MTEFEASTAAIAAHAGVADTGPARVQADWVFGYGSLIWDPGFPFEDSSLAQVHGYHRTFCIRSTRYRGTPDAPGVVLGLDRGGSCIGVAFRLHPDRRGDAIRALYEREMINQVYVPSLLNATLRNGTRIRALTFVANRQNVSYERLSDAEIVRRLNCCHGQRGQNRDYAIRTWHSLDAHGVHCPHLARIGRRLLDNDCP
jgi:glutathione-specific gamma-glutamylcyclotransferase